MIQLSMDPAAVAESIAFCVLGDPVPQGSKAPRIVGRRIKTPTGKIAVIEPTVVLTESMDMATKTRPGGRLKKWRKAITDAAYAAWRAHHEGRSPDPWDGPMELSARFTIARPVSDWLKKGAIRKGAHRAPRVKPDLDKLARAIADSMSGVIYGDDAQIVGYRRLSKIYQSSQSDTPGVRVEVYRV